jgi:four helix bundle protein
MITNETRIEFIERTQLRCKKLAIGVLELCDSFSYKQNSLKIISYQLGKSASSVAANYNAACRARSGKEFYSKMSITAEEVDETVLWLEMLIEGSFKVDSEKIRPLLSEAIGILKIVATARKNAKK